jgi:hypothetical protein
MGFIEFILDCIIFVDRIRTLKDDLRSVREDPKPLLGCLMIVISLSVFVFVIWASSINAR